MAFWFSEGDAKLVIHKQIEVKRKYYKQDVQYRLCSFWLDRDDEARNWVLAMCVGRPQRLVEGFPETVISSDFFVMNFREHH